MQKKQRKTITEKTRDLFKKIENKGTFHAKMGTIKKRNDKDLREAADIKKRWQEFAELYKQTNKQTKTNKKKDFHDLDNHDGVISHLEPDILECKSSGP